MRKFLTIIFVFAGLLTFAQPPQGINYQAVVRNSSGQPYINTAVSLKFIIHDGSVLGAAVFNETIDTVTNAFGLVSLKIGAIANLSTVNWASGDKYLQVETDVNHTGTYSDLGTSQLLSVPYAFYSGTTDNPNQWQKNGNNVYYNAGNVGIGTATPTAALDVKNGNVVFEGDISGGVPVSGTGSRMFWSPRLSAFRAGFAQGTEWDDDSVGFWSFATGYGAKALGQGSVAMGFSVNALDAYSFALGKYCTAGGQGSVAIGLYTYVPISYSTAIGNNDTAIGQGTIAMGLDNTAGAYYSVAIGQLNKISGDGSFAIGNGCRMPGNYSYALGAGDSVSGAGSMALGFGNNISGDNAIAIGNYNNASGDHSTAMGSYASTNGKTGSFVIGDYNTTLLTSDANDQMKMRFLGGYKLYTNAAATIGASMATGGNSWATMSDRRIKENLAPTNGEEFLKKISTFKLYSWNYIGQDPKIFRHYGPMAQDFYAAFGKDAYGTIGNDTTIAQADFEGVSFVAIQALEKRTEELKEAVKLIDLLMQKNEALEKRVAKLEK